jgi:hypothetical protein
MPISLQDLTTAAGVLRRAKALCETVRDIFRGNDTDAAARMGDIVERIDAEHDYTNRLILATDPNGDAHA